jgi:hypothetical protein
MPYFIFQTKQTPGSPVKKLTLTNKFDNYRQAKANIKNLRDKATPEETQDWKMIFAESELQAEELLQEKREAPVLMEWEK